MAARNEEKLAPRHVSSIMTRHVDAVGPDAPLSEVRDLFAQRALHHVLVVAGERLVGLIALSDLVRAGMDPTQRAEPGLSQDNLLARHVMQERSTVVTASEDMTVGQAAATLSDGSFHALPIVDANDRLLGIVTSTDLIRYLAELEAPMESRAR